MNPEASRSEITPGGIYMISGWDDCAELLTKQRCPYTRSLTWECAHNRFDGTWDDCRAEALRREAYVLAKKAA